MSQGKQDEINSLITKSVSVLSFLAIPMMVALVLIAPTFIPLFFGQDFTGSVLPMQVLSLLMIATGFNNLTGTQILLSIGKDKSFLYSVLAGTFSNFILNLILIPYCGAVGASIASAFAEFMVLFMTIYYIKKETTVRVNNYGDTFKSLCSLIPMVIGYFICRCLFTGWFFVIAFTIVGSAFYIISQIVIKNNSALLFLNIVRNKIRK